ncbi:MAG: transposase [Desulfovibrio sp.]|nr:transposase [Desulfovibrio sp.]
MGWTAAARRQYGVRVSTDANSLTDREWAMIAPFMPALKRRGRPRKTDLRLVVDAILYIAWTGCQWRALDQRFPPVSTVQRFFYRWRDDGTLRRINHHLMMASWSASRPTSAPTCHPPL